MLRRAVLILAITVPLRAAITWEKWDDSLFARAKREHRFVLLDLEAVWCHWCHVMDDTTYRDPAVAALIAKKYIAVRVDQDSRPDLSNRYGDWGWPATIVFNANAGEIVRRRGFLAPDEMRSMLQAIIDDPSPGPSVWADAKPTLPEVPRLSDSLRAEVIKKNDDFYDAKHGGWGFSHKYLDALSVEYALAHDPDKARQTLTAALQIIDPKAGGIYQYSVGGDWKEPHFEKIMSMQAGALRTYSLAYARWHDPAYLHAAQSVRNFVTRVLRGSEGAFYTSQDADFVNGERRVDKNIYARENGWIIEALATYADATGDRAAPAAATRAADWINAHRSLPNGGYKHGLTTQRLYLGDTLAMANAQLALYASTRDRRWLSRAETSARFIESNFRASAGYTTTKSSGTLAAAIDHDENVAAARFGNLLFRYTNNKQWQSMSAHAMRYLAAPEVARLLPAGGVLLADYETTHVMASSSTHRSP